MRNVIRQGDATTHGGKVINTKATHFKVGGIPVACVGDLCVCPMTGHSNCRIVSGSERHRINGMQLAFEGDKTSCGAKLISSLTNFKAG